MISRESEAAGKNPGGFNFDLLFWSVNP